MTDSITLKEFAPAKINLCLHVTGKRGDGYHLLQSLVIFSESGDVLEARILPQNNEGEQGRQGILRLEYSGGFAADLPQPEDNLILRAAHMLRQETGIRHGAELTLHKNLPVAGGIGGGSADAAAALRLLARLWDIDIDVYATTLEAIAAGLGADVPACLLSQPLWMQGIGDNITVLEQCPQIPLLLVNPAVAVSTRRVFAACGEKYHPPLSQMPPRFSDTKMLVDFLNTTGNDLQPVAEELYQEIKTVMTLLDAQKGCLLSRMSGSGGTCFGIFDSMENAKQAAVEISGKKAEGWLLPTMSSAAAVKKSF